ncbi:PTS system fructose-specific IIA component [Sinobaca qinghaiensis]|uniref:PTS system fructose-specific IIA component n=1 Tax=Sinobaca qinghaiensis TaxID=342944 RepID=A0A419V4A7_9BACL|nr:fructose PTS transporter subunit IIA [Sinobaca qinghaiensis]RKD73358.1 PTS system fructose-specific IIA component [Sinobaca qinghaiensis]
MMQKEKLDLKELMNEHTINLHSRADSKMEVLKEMVSKLESIGSVSDASSFLKDVYAREKEGFTGIGSSIAIPHGKSESVIKNTIMIYRTNQPIEWETLDDLPVRVIILLAVKIEDQNNLHLKMLASIAGSLADEARCERITKVESKQKLIQILEQNEEGEDQ